MIRGPHDGPEHFLKVSLTAWQSKRLLVQEAYISKNRRALHPSSYYSTNLYLTNVHTASKASCNFIFLPCA